MTRPIKSKDALGRDRYVNEENGRCVIVALFGAACYEGTIVDGNYSGIHRGIVCTDEEIREWLDGGSPKMQRIYSVKNSPGDGAGE